MLIVTVQVVPEQAPLQVTKVEPAAGAAVKVTVFPVGKLALHVFPQLMPLGALVTVPEPDPLLWTVRVCMLTGAVKVAVTVWSLIMTTIQVEMTPPHPPPLQLGIVEPPVPVSTTWLPLGKLASQAGGQEIPLGLLVTVPVPFILTVR